MSTPDRACPDYPNECLHPWAHARTYAEVKATQTKLRCYRINSNYRTVCGQWSDAEPLTDWSAVTCPECRRRGLRSRP